MFSSTSAYGVGGDGASGLDVLRRRTRRTRRALAIDEKRGRLGLVRGPSGALGDSCDDTGGHVIARRAERDKITKITK